MMEPIALEPGSTLLVLTGAGISAASGLRPFRGAGGCWTDDPELIWQIYGPLRKPMQQAVPNAAHYALARLQKESGCDVRLVTQNVDGLHQRA